MVLTSIVAGCELVVGVGLDEVVEDVFDDCFGKNAVVAASADDELAICKLVQHH